LDHGLPGAAGNGMAAAESLGQLTVINLTVSFIFAIAR
jgi:hypothetical protein